jgi:hypothetical protein
MEIVVTEQDDTDSPDPPLTHAEKIVVESLPVAFVERVDAVLLSHAKKRERKVAMVVGLAMMDNELRVLRLPDVYYAQRVKLLVQKGLLLAEGNLDYMRYSEVRLP